MRIFTAAACLTLLADGYLVLASLATASMYPRYHHWLPPFGWETFQAVPKPYLLTVVAWTAFLALGCLTPRSDQPPATAQRPQNEPRPR